MELLIISMIEEIARVFSTNPIIPTEADATETRRIKEKYEYSMEMMDVCIRYMEASLENDPCIFAEHSCRLPVFKTPQLLSKRPAFWYPIDKKMIKILVH